MSDKQHFILKTTGFETVYQMAKFSREFLHHISWLSVGEMNNLLRRLFLFDFECEKNDFSPIFNGVKGVNKKNFSNCRLEA